MNPEAYLEMADNEGRHWWFVGRRSIVSTVLASLDLSGNAKILEIGSGTGGNLDMLSAFGRVSGLEMDPNARAISMEKTQGRFDVRMGVCPDDIPFEGEQFDLVCLFDVLEHIRDDVQTLIAVRSLLKKNGKVLLTVPAYPWMWGVHDEFLHHVRRYTRGEVREKARASGFRQLKLTHFNTLLFPLAAAARLKDRLMGSSVASGSAMPPNFINRAFTRVFGMERLVVRSLGFPFGVSLLCILQADGAEGESVE